MCKPASLNCPIHIRLAPFCLKERNAFTALNLLWSTFDGTANQKKTEMSLDRYLFPCPLCLPLRVYLSACLCVWALSGRKMKLSSGKNGLSWSADLPSHFQSLLVHGLSSYNVWGLLVFLLFLGGIWWSRRESAWGVISWTEGGAGGSIQTSVPWTCWAGAGPDLPMYCATTHSPKQGWRLCQPQKLQASVLWFSLLPLKLPLFVFLSLFISHCFCIGSVSASVYLLCSVVLYVDVACVCLLHFAHLLLFILDCVLSCYYFVVVVEGRGATYAYCMWQATSCWAYFTLFFVLILLR